MIFTELLAFDGGNKCFGKVSGNSEPSNLILIKYIAKANSSESKRPSLSWSANFHILDNTESGNFDCRNSSLTAKKKKNRLESTFNRAQIITNKH